MTKFKRILAAVFILQLVTQLVQVTGYKIVMATPEIGSHVLTKLVIGRTLVNRGHDVHLILSNRFPVP